MVLGRFYEIRTWWVKPRRSVPWGNGIRSVVSAVAAAAAGVLGIVLTTFVSAKLDAGGPKSVAVLVGVAAAVVVFVGGLVGLPRQDGGKVVDRGSRTGCAGSGKRRAGRAIQWTGSDHRNTHQADTGHAGGRHRRLLDACRSEARVPARRSPHPAVRRHRPGRGRPLTVADLEVSDLDLHTRVPALPRQGAKDRRSGSAPRPPVRSAAQPLPARLRPTPRCCTARPVAGRPRQRTLNSEWHQDPPQAARQAAGVAQVHADRWRHSFGHGRQTPPLSRVDKFRGLPEATNDLLLKSRRIRYTVIV